ncbi:MAG: ATP-binding cassette domain-containing protein [Clostridiales bacterium]|nr:ATP-binding cassette domain-containing protein [Clostridiales bacterium]
MNTILKTSGLTKVYAGKKVVSQVNMTVKQGDIYGFIGENGAGKTTLIRMVSGLAATSEGSIELFGSKSLNQHRKRIGTIIEYPAVHVNLSAKENLAIYSRLLGVNDNKKIENILEIIGLNDVGSKNVKKFSLGMKQRLGIGIALIGNPDFLMLDEPINGLDPSGIKEMRELFQRLNREMGITILISSHILGELSKIATRYGIIKKGVLIDEFKSEELYDRCKRSLKISVDNPARAANILETILGTKQFDVLENNYIRVFDMLDRPEIVNKELVTNGVSVYSLQMAGQDLEDYFMNLMG